MHKNVGNSRAFYGYFGNPLSYTMTQSYIFLFFSRAVGTVAAGGNLSPPSPQKRQNRTKPSPSKDYGWVVLSPPPLQMIRPSYGLIYLHNCWPWPLFLIAFIWCWAPNGMQTFVTMSSNNLWSCIRSIIFLWFLFFPLILLKNFKCFVNFLKLYKMTSNDFKRLQKAIRPNCVCLCKISYSFFSISFYAVCNECIVVH